MYKKRYSKIYIITVPGTDLEGFEPSISGLEARRYILAKPQALFVP